MIDPVVPCIISEDEGAFASPVMSQILACPPARVVVGSRQAAAIAIKCLNGNSPYISNVYKGDDRQFNQITAQIGIPSCTINYFGF